MTKLSLHAFSAPTFARMLKNLAAILAKAEQQAKTKGYDPSVLLSARLAPDMFPLIRQVQIATDHAKGAVARLTGNQVEAIEDKEITFADLQARIAKVIAIGESYKPDQYDGAETRESRARVPSPGGCISAHAERSAVTRVAKSWLVRSRSETIVYCATCTSTNRLAVARMTRPRRTSTETRTPIRRPDFRRRGDRPAAPGASGSPRRAMRTRPARLRSTPPPAAVPPSPPPRTARPRARRR